MSSAVQEAIAKAQEAAGAIVAQNQNTAPVAANSGGNPSMADLMSNTSSVDAYLKLTEDGVKLGEDPKLHEELTLLMDLGKAERFHQITYGNPATYAKSRDLVTDTSGRPWSDVLQLAAKVDPKARPYMTANLVFEVIEDIQGKNGVTPEGTEIGYTLPFMGVKEFTKMLKSLAAQGHDIEDGSFYVTVSAVGASNAKGNKYAKIQFKDARPA